MNVRRVRALLVLAGVLFGLALPAGIFFSRPPALILSDASFDALYGVRRALIAQVRLSLSLFRPVKKVMLAESAGPDAAAFALEEASGRPWGAILPARYGRGGRRYAEDHPQTPVAIIEGRESRGRGAPGDAGRNLAYIAADSQTDAYRAGRCAAILALAGGGGILFFQDEVNFPFNRESFIAGLREEGFMENPVFLATNSNYAAPGDISCVVMTGQIPIFVEKNTKAPVILFSWLDTALTPANVKLIFDDSPWAMAFKVFRQFPGGGSAEIFSDGKPLPSKITIPGGRIGDPEVLQKIKTAVQADFL
ncbi:hypothetical protein AGMMS49546_30650 [Spirochaetia bacterium]|nr:hypothetical protein AGMMS49546_30650 [Spirochaetia bacterium]